MLLGGLWHGASWNFVLWGGLHGAALATHKLWRRRFGPMPALLGWALTFLFVALCWVPFRAQGLGTTLTMLSRMFDPGVSGISWIPVLTVGVTVIAIVGHLAGATLDKAAGGALGRDHIVWRALGVLGYRLDVNAISGWRLVFGVGTTAGAALLCFWILVLYFFARTDSSPFIYFQF